jgi:hypothetical protein
VPAGGDTGGDGRRAFEDRALRWLLVAVRL